MDYTFNWFYVNLQTSPTSTPGANPIKPRDALPTFRCSPAVIWRHSSPRTLSGATPYPVALTPFRRHPQVIDQNFLTSWNNKQAPGYRAADDNWNFGPVFRSTALDERVKALIKGKRKASLPGLIEAMKEASTVDVRPHTVLPRPSRHDRTPSPDRCRLLLRGTVGC